jgi:ABC-type transport system involved in multi-copper enzyme maturation permease subunit
MIWKIVKKEFLLIKGFDPKRASIPDMHYQYQTLSEALQAGWADILLLCIFNILFFIAAFLRFRKYDVR